MRVFNADNTSVPVHSTVSEVTNKLRWVPLGTPSPSPDTGNFVPPNQPPDKQTMKLQTMKLQQLRVIDEYWGATPGMKRAGVHTMAICFCGGPGDDTGEVYMIRRSEWVDIDAVLKP